MENEKKLKFFGDPLNFCGVLLFGDLSLFRSCFSFIFPLSFFSEFSWAPFESLVVERVLRMLKLV
jgi:hypothetical protein